VKYLGNFMFRGYLCLNNAFSVPGKVFFAGLNLPLVIVAGRAQVSGELNIFNASFLLE